MIALALARSGKAPVLAGIVDASGNAIPDAAQAAFPLMVKAILPAGIRGLVVAGLLAALMSSLAGAFNACSTLFTMDLYQKFRPGVTQHQLVWTGRVATAVMVLIGLLWIPVIQGGKGLYDYLQGVQGYLAPPIFTVFIFGVSAVTMLVVSYATPPPAEERLVGLTYATVTAEQRQQSRSSWSRGDVTASAIVLLLILAAYLYFRG